jgi:hypothetical protein
MRLPSSPHAAINTASEIQRRIARCDSAGKIRARSRSHREREESMKRSHLISALALSIVGSAGAVIASTITNTPGATCVASNGTLVATADGQSANLTTSSATAVCPIDRELAPTASTKVAATVWIVDESTTANVCCSLHSKSPAGPELNSGVTCSSGASATYKTLSLAQVTDAATYSHYFITCSVPGMSSGLVSKVLTYRSIED